MLSQSEENYLKTIYHLLADENETANTNAIAARLETKPSSVSDMLKKLHGKGLIQYEKYKEPVLTSEGEMKALGIIRKHRLWEYFLHEKLNLSWDKVHDIAEQLEHIQSTLLVEKLDQYLGHPEFDPHGDPIPKKDGKFIQLDQYPLSETELGKLVKISGLRNHETDFLQYLNQIKIEIGTQIEVMDVVRFDKSMTVKINQTSKVTISNEVAQNLLVCE